MRRFAQGVIAFIGESDGSFAWLARAALVTPKVLGETRFTTPWIARSDLPHLPFWLAQEWKLLWQAEDREEARRAWKRERRRLHRLIEIKKRGPFDTIARDEYLANRPLWSIEASGVGAFTFKRMLKVRIPSLEQEVWVSLAGMAKSLGIKKRKLLRLKKGAIPRELEERVYQVVKDAVARELAR